MNNAEILKKLAGIFGFEDISWKIQVTNRDKTQGMAVPYLDSRAIQKRLDEAVGAMNWRNEFLLWQKNAQICGISLFNAEREQWITKYDGAENTDIEPIKGGLSDSFKRAAAIWGIGRYLYDMETLWVEIEPYGKSYRIKKGEYDKLRWHYDKNVAMLSGKAPTPDKAQGGNMEQPPYEDYAPDTEDYAYIVKSTSVSGNSVCLTLANKEGKEVSVYARKGDNSLRSGTKLRNAKFVKGKSDFGEYFTMSEYDIAA